MTTTEPGQPPPVDAALVGRIFREESGRSVATLVRVFGDVDLAEDAVQEAFEVALDVWPSRGLPANPGGWITITARNRAVNRVKRERRGRELVQEAAAAEPPPDPIQEGGVVEDDQLRLIFMCCHPALAPEARIALTLRLLGGVGTEEVARGFLVAEATMAQRLVRAKRKIKAARVPFAIPEEHDLPDRLASVLKVLYLVYTAGLVGEGGDELRREGIRLTRTLVRLMPDEPEAAGLLALLLLTEARVDARTGRDGRLVVLADQDRGRWDRELIDEGHELVRRCLLRDRPGPYQLEAAINAVHTDAPTAEETDWHQVVALYDQLLAISPTPVVALNRAVAVAEVDGAAAAFDLVEPLRLHGYAPYHAVRADLLVRLGRDDEARAEYAAATQAAPTEAERVFLAGGGRHGIPTSRG